MRLFPFYELVHPKQLQEIKGTDRKSNSLIIMLFMELNPA